MASRTFLFFAVLACHIYATMSLVDLSAVRIGNQDNKNLEVVFIHGLDSSSHTWRNVMPLVCAETSVPCVAFDLRRCGSSPLGENFSLDAMVEDINQAVGSKIVLVGHSLGGRVAMAFAASHSDKVAALVVEDMDICRRAIESSVFPITKSNQPFDRSFDSMEDAMKALENAGYPREKIQSWISEGRIHHKEGKWWSDVNPDFRRLCYERIFDTNLGQDVWSQLISLEADNKLFPCHFWVAGDSVCKEESLDYMKKTLKSAQFRFFPGATHSIHSSVLAEFVACLSDIAKLAASD